MTKTLEDLMKQAAALTRGGDLQAATAAIQAALAGARPGAAGWQPGPGTAPFTVVLPTPPTAAGGPARHAGASADAVAEIEPAAGGHTLTGRHRGAAGERDFRLHVPPQAGSGPLPLVVMLHGCTQDPDDFAAGTAMDEAADRRGCYVLYPAQSQQANPQRCWNWFKHTHQQRGRGEPGLLAGMTAQVQAAHRIDASRIFVAGLSAGGAMAAILGSTYPEVFAAVGVHSGLAAGAAKDLPSALQAMQRGGEAPALASAVRTIVFHGSQDSTVHPRNGEQIGEQVGAAMAARREAVPVPEQPGRRAVTRHVWRHDDGRIVGEHWLVHGAPHAWSGGSARGSYTDASGPDATREMLRFFLDD